MPEARRKRRWDFVPLLALVLLLGGGWLLFPRLHAEMMWQDCVASGRTNCEVQ